VHLRSAAVNLILDVWLQRCHVCIWGDWPTACTPGLFLISSVVVAEFRIIGRGTNSSASHITPIRCPMNPSSETLSWVRISPPHLFCSRFVYVFSLLDCDRSIANGWFRFFFVHVSVGQLVWRRFDPACIPSHRAVCTTCVQLLPLIEMYCKWELQDDCNNLWELMLRFAWDIYIAYGQ
jgi:hypothetical protein